MELHFYDSLPSTNRTAYEAAREGAEEFYTVVAKCQTAGRGRLSRSFHSPAGGVYFSTVLRPVLPFSQYGRITPVAAVAVHRALVHVTGVVAQLKWVNDLLLCGKKICGILAESGTDLHGDPFVILGVGINTAPVEFPPELREVATFVPCEDNAALIGAILAELAPYEQIIEKGTWLDYYREYCSFLGQVVAVIQGDQVRCGVALDVLEDGALKVDFGHGAIEELRGGEISLRLAQNCEI
ncbi:MAG: biotin--[Clostridia bacterium]|nr:biotin--[acetyl-CoA-carboxylase] ligase [Clostridia bacterium]